MHTTEDKAWAEFKTPFDQDSLLNFFQDVERLFRINPYLEFENWKKTTDQEFFMHVANNSQIPEFKLKTNFKLHSLQNGIRIHYDQGIKSDTTFIAETIPEGTKLTITENYHAVPPHESSKQLQQVDKSLTKWAEEIQTYLILWQRWSWFLPWRYYKQKIWQPMKPAARRITYMLIWISLIEIIVIGLAVVIYSIESR